MLLKLKNEWNPWYAWYEKAHVPKPVAKKTTPSTAKKTKQSKKTEVKKPLPKDPSGPSPLPWVEEKGLKPVASASWCVAYWNWNGFNWVWVSGLWELPEEKQILAQKPVPKKERISPASAPKAEYVSPPPAPEQVWISGAWRWNGRAFFWIPGKWTKLPLRSIKTAKKPVQQVTPPKTK